MIPHITDFTTSTEVPLTYFDGLLVGRVLKHRTSLPLLHATGTIIRSHITRVIGEETRRMGKSERVCGVR